MSDEAVSIIRTLAHPADPIPTGETPRLTPLPEVTVIIWDVYGTLFISASGDVGLTAMGDRGAAMAKSLQAEGIDYPHAEKLPGEMDALIQASHGKAKRQGIDHPEVEIQEIWNSLLASAGLPHEESLIARLALRYENEVNPVWPMPGARDTLDRLQNGGYPMGIISNAQFYTPPLFPALLDASLSSLGFDPDLCIWSFEEREVKPTIRLFESLRERLVSRGKQAHEILYIGNDLRNDIDTACRAGFRTALFAGDRRSLRWRIEDGLTVVPDLVLTELPQLFECLSGLDAER